MATSAKIEAKSLGNGYLCLWFMQGDTPMKFVFSPDVTAAVVLQCGGDATDTELKAVHLNAALEDFNALLESWCS